MSTTVLLSIHALCSSDDALLARELRVASIRSQCAVVRTLLDEVDRLSPSSMTQEAMSAQLADELARLGRCILEAAAARSHGQRAV